MLRDTSRRLLVAVALLIGASVGHAAPITFADQSLQAGWNVGTGQTNNHFIGVRDSTFQGQSLELGLRATQRFVTSLTPTTYNGSPGNNMYVVQTGQSTPATGAWWNFDFSVADSGGINNLNALGMTFQVLAGNLTPLPDVNFNTSAIPGHLDQDSWNPEFGFLGGPSYNANATGIYLITLSATENGQTESTSILVNVGNVPFPTPEPTTIAIFGVMGVAGAFYGWRRKRSA